MATKYILRFDTYEGGKTIEDRIINDISNPNDPQNVLIAGFPGVGKSCTSKAIAARYISDGNPAVILSVQNKNRIGSSKITLVDIGNFAKGISQVVAVPIVNISKSSTNSEEIVKEIIHSLTSLEKDLERTKELIGSVSDITKIKEGLEKLIDKEIIPKENLAISQLANDIVSSLPYIRSALNIALSVFKYYQRRRQDIELNKLRKQNLLIVIDDIKDLGDNWQILSNIWEDSFRYALVSRIENIDEYIKLIDDRTYSNIYLNKKSYSVLVNKLEIVPPPSKNIFDDIMANHEIRKEDVDSLWSISGGIPAIALMILQENPTITNRDLDLIIQEIGNLIRNKSEIYWSESDYRKRLAMALYATIQIYEKLIKKNKAYGIFCCERDGVTQDEILIFCGCESITSVIHIPSVEKETKKRIEKIISEKNCCPDGRKLTIMDLPFGGTDCCIGELRDSIVKNYVPYFDSDNFLDKPNSDILDGNHQFSSTPKFIKQDQVYYKFSELFEHVPVFLKIIEEIEKSGYKISSTYKTISSDL